jgi:hypothetical protein
MVAAYAGLERYRRSSIASELSALTAAGVRTVPQRVSRDLLIYS